MHVEASEADFQLTKGQWLAFRVVLYSIPVAVLGIAIYCLVNHVPNPRSIVPKSVIALINSLAMFLLCDRLDLKLQSSKMKVKDLRTAGIMLAIGATICAGLTFLMIRAGEFNLTGDGDPFFPILWLIVMMVHWLLVRIEKPKVVEQ